MRAPVKGKVNQMKQEFKKKGNNYKPVKKNVSDYMYFLGLALQAAEYESTTEFLINHFKQTLNLAMMLAQL